MSIAKLLDDVVRLQDTLCPNCGDAKLRYHGQHGTIRESFSKWEEATGGSLPRVMVAQYPVDENYYLLECPHCSFLTFSPRTAGTTEYYKAVADASYYEGVKKEFRRAIEVLQKHEVSSLLEVGAGGGAFLQCLKEDLPSVDRFACEKNPTTLESLNGLAKVYDGFESLDRQFDAVCAFQLLEHLEDPFGFVDTCRGALQDGGHLLISVPDYSGPYRYYGDSWTEVPPHHLTRWSRHSLRALLVNRGFSCSHIIRLPLGASYFPTYIPLLWWLVLRALRLDKNLWLIEKGKRFPGWLREKGVKRLPFVPMTLLAVAQKN